MKNKKNKCDKCGAENCSTELVEIQFRPNETHCTEQWCDECIQNNNVSHEYRKIIYLIGDKQDE